MIEILRAYAGYCSECRLPKFVGDFRLVGWEHVFPLCDECLNRKREQLIEAMNELANRALSARESR